MTQGMISLYHLLSTFEYIMFHLKGKVFQSYLLSTCTSSCKCGFITVVVVAIISVCILDFVIALVVCIIVDLKESKSAPHTMGHELEADVQAPLAGQDGWYKDSERCEICSFSQTPKDFPSIPYLETTHKCHLL